MGISNFSAFFTAILADIVSDQQSVNIFLTALSYQP